MVEDTGLESSLDSLEGSRASQVAQGFGKYSESLDCSHLLGEEKHLGSDLNYQEGLDFFFYLTVDCLVESWVVPVCSV